MFYNYLNIVFLGIIISVTSCSKPKIYENKKPDQEIIINGKADDWGNDFAYDKQSKLFYSLHNDNQKIYICVKVSDENVKKKIFLHGMGLFIDTTGKNKERIAIKFPLSRVEKKIKNNSNENRKQPDLRELEKSFLTSNIEMDVKGFPILQDFGNEYSRTSSKSPIGIYGKVDIDTMKVLVYEIEVSLSTIYGNQKDKAGNILGIKIIAGKVEGNKEKRGTEGPPSTNGPMNMNGGGAVPPRPIFEENPITAEPMELKLKVKLI